MEKRYRVIDTHIDFESACERHSADERVIYKTVNGMPLYIGLYGVNGTENVAMRRPLIIFVHGGSWKEKKIFPDQDDWQGDYLGFLARYYSDRGFICASIDYRLMNGAGHSDGCELIDLYEDCMDAVQYLSVHACEYGIDARHTVVLGESAGGYLAAAMVTLPIRDKSFIKGAILVNPITDLSDERWKRVIMCESRHPFLNGKTLEEKIKILSPVDNISLRPCPTLLLHGEKDTVVSPVHSERFYRAVKAIGGSVAYARIEDTNHAFLLVEYMRELNQSVLPAGVATREIDNWLYAFLKNTAAI